MLAEPTIERAGGGSHPMRRRDFLLGATAIMAARAVCAQQKTMPLVGILNLTWPPRNLGDVGRGPFAQGLNQAGFVEGRKVVIERRWGEGHYDRLPVLAADLVAREVDVIVALNGTPSALAAKNATSTIRIVFASVGDPVGIGLVASFARPGGNITGFTNITTELAQAG